MEVRFFMPMIPPRTTAQQKRVGVTKNGKQVRYEDASLKAAHEKLLAHLVQHAPDKPMKGPIRLVNKWLYLDSSQRHEEGEWKITKPDTDNTLKLLKDCMTACHFWNDDAQVCSEISEKFWTRETPGIYIEVSELE